MHASASSVQLDAESVIRRLVSAAVGVDLQPRRLRLSESTNVDVDGVSDDEQILVEIFARQGTLKGGQVRKVAMDALKLITLGRTRPSARLILAFASNEAAAYVENPNAWLTEALRAGNVEVLVVNPPADIRTAVLAAQARQHMGNTTNAEPTPSQ